MASRLAFTLLVATLACVVGPAVAGDPHLGSLEYSFYDSGGAQLTGDTEVDLPAALSLDEQYTFVVVVPQATVAIEQVALVFVGVVDTAIAGDVVSGELIPFASGTDVATISLTVTDTNDGETQEYVVVFMRNFGVIENLPIGLNSDMEANVMVSLVDNYAAAGFDPLDLDLDALAGIVASLTRVVGSGTLDVSLLGMFEIFDLAVALVVAADDLSLFPNLAEVGAGLASQLNEVMNDGDSVTCDDCYGGESHFVLGKFDSMVASKVLCNAPGGLGTGSDLCIDFGTTFPTTATSVLVTLIMAPPAGPIDGDDDLADNLDTFSSYLVNLYDGDTGDAIVVNSGASINQAFTNPMVAGVPNEVTDTAPATGFISTFSAGYFDGDDAKDNGVSDVTCDDAASTCSFDATHLTGFFVAVDACASYSLCGTCTAQPECGWCNSANLCATGDASGPTEGGSYCPGNWDFDDCECVNQVEVADGTNPSELSAVVGPIDFVVTMDPADVEYPLNIQVEAEYLRDKTTYVIDFTEFATDGSRTLREPGVCENRRFRDFQNFPSTWWESAPAPGSEGALGTTTYRAYPPSIAHEDDETTPVWTISSVDAVGLGCNGGLTASPRVTYSGDFSLSDLSKCTHANGNSAVNVNADPLGWHVEAELFVKAIQDNEATTDNDEDVVAVATSGGGLLSDSVVIDVYGFKCHHEEDGLVGTAVEDPLTGDFYCMCESGYGNSLYLDSPVCHLKVAANCLPGDPDRLNADIYEGSVDGSTLTVSVRVPIVAGRRVTSISYGGDPTGLRPECNYPGPTWVHTHRTVGCYDIFTMTLDTNSLLGCGVERVYTESEPEGLFVAPGARREVREDGATISQYVSYSADVTVTIEDDIEVETSVGTEIQTRVTNNNLRFVTAYPAQYVISTTAEFTSDHSLEALIVGQQWDFLNNVAIINLATLVRFPYKLTAMTATLTVEGTSIPLDPSTDPSSCPDGEGEVACLQDWEITIVPEIACRVTGVYNFAVTLGCRDEPDTADFLTACVADEASLVVDLQADDICNLAFLDESNGVVADLVTYTSETYTVETAAYFLGEFIYGEARVSSSSWSLESVDFSFATLIFKDDVLPDAVALDAEEGDQIFNPDGSISRRFRAYLTSQVAPQLTQGVTEDYTLWATVTVGYQDGSKRRAEVRAIQGLKPSTTLSITGTAAAAVGPEGTGGLASTVSAPTIALGVAGAALVVVIVVAVVFKLRSGPGSTKGKDLEGAGVSSTAVSSTSGASSTGGAGSSTEEYYYYYQDDVRRGDKANDASSTSASTSAASVSEFGMF